MNACLRIAWILLSLAAANSVSAQIWVYDTAKMRGEEIGTFGGDESEATGVNNHLAVVGWARLPNGVPHAFHSHFGDLTDLTPGLATGTASYAQGINPFGEVVGYYEPNGGLYPAQSSAFYWVEGGGPIETLDPGELTGFRGRAIDKFGRMAGEKYGIGPVPANPSAPCFGTLPVNWPYAYTTPYSLFCVQYGNELRTTGINEYGHIVGYEMNTPTSEYKSWRTGIGSKTTVPKPAASTLPKGATSTCGMRARGINKDDFVVGSASICFPTSPIERAFLWNPVSTTSKLLGVLSGGDSSEAFAVNDEKFVVGMSEKFVNGVGTFPGTIRNRAFVYHSNFGMVSLPLPDGFFAQFTDCAALAVSNVASEYVYAAGYCTKGSKKLAVMWHVELKIYAMQLPGELDFP